MNNPFNPDRFLYVDSHSPNQGRSIRPKSVRDMQTCSQSAERDHSSPGTLPTAGSTSAIVTNEPVDGANGHKKFGFRFYPLASISGLCIILLLAGAAYILRGLAERSSLPSSSPTDIPPAVKAYIDQAVFRLSRDSVGLRDFALYANGGRVIRELTGVSLDGDLPLPSMDNSPNASLVDDLRVGNCWKFPGEAGQLGFRTSEMVYPTHVTIDHIPFEIAADIGQAPRSMALWGAIDGSRNAENLHSIFASPTPRIPDHLGRTQPRLDENLTFILLATFTYDIYSPEIVQTFPIECIMVDARISFGVFVLDILSNWGGEATCLYRVRIHGETALL